MDLAAVDGGAAALLGLLGLLIGSFLNVLIHRLPVMLERQWAEECAGTTPQTPTPASAPRYNLWTPPSCCPHCGQRIGWRDNVPLLSFVLLRGRCRACAHPIGWRYPTVEALTGLVFAGVGLRLGWTPEAWAWCGFCAAVIALGFIDWDTTLLPDDLTLPLLWAGLVLAALGGVPRHLPEAFWGAVAGYLSLWSIYWLFKLATGKEGMGYGDFKLFAALGAWFGWQALVPLILIASLCGVVVGIGMKWRSRLREGGYVPFGPFLALAGLVGVLFPGSLKLLETLG